MISLPRFSRSCIRLISVGERKEVELFGIASSTVDYNSLRDTDDQFRNCKTHAFIKCSDQWNSRYQQHYRRYRAQQSVPVSVIVIIVLAAREGFRSVLSDWDLHALSREASAQVGAFDDTGELLGREDLERGGENGGQDRNRGSSSI